MYSSVVRTDFLFSLVPCGLPPQTGLRLEKQVPTLKRIRRLVKKAAVIAKESEEAPDAASATRHAWWLMRLKALLKSMESKETAESVL